MTWSQPASAHAEAPWPLRLPHSALSDAVMPLQRGKGGTRKALP